MNYQALINQAAAFAQSGQYSEMEPICRKILKKKPKHFDALQLLGLAQTHTGQLSDAIRHLKRARKLNPDHASVRLNLANACLHSGQGEDAIKFSREAIKLDSSMFEAHIALGNGLQSTNQYETARQSYETALQLNRHSAEARDGLGETRRKQGNLSSAVELFIEANELNPKLSTVYIHLFQTLLLMHAIDDALSVANSGLNSGTLNAAEAYELQIGIAKIYWLTGRIEDTDQVIKQANHSIGNSQSYQNIANLQAYHGCLIYLLQLRNEQQQLYQGSADNAIFFVAESHALAPSEVVVNFQNTPHRILSSLITGCKIWHLIGEDRNEYQASLESLFAALPQSSIVILGFGEIDCRASEGILKAFRDKGIDYKLSIPKLIETYMNIALNLAASGQHQLMLYGVPAPNIGQLSSLEKDHEQQLCDVIQLFNQSLKQSCEENGLEFLDVYALTADENGRGNGEYHIDAHHLHPRVLPLLFEGL